MRHIDMKFSCLGKVVEMFAYTESCCWLKLNKTQRKLLDLLWYKSIFLAALESSFTIRHIYIPINGMNFYVVKTLIGDLRPKCESKINIKQCCDHLNLETEYASVVNWG